MCGSELPQSRAAKRRKTSGRPSSSIMDQLSMASTTFRESSSGSSSDHDDALNSVASLFDEDRACVSPNDGDEPSHSRPEIVAEPGLPVVHSPATQGPPSHGFMGPPTWPPDLIPVEIFNLIVHYLPRSDVESMRQVNHEFDSKLADRFFRNVVVTFRPEFAAVYGALGTDLDVVLDQQKYGLVFKSNRDEGKPPGAEDSNDSGEKSGPGKQDEESLLSDGFRVFEQFGLSTIKKFALALELDENDLAYPPIKLNQEILKAPWGLYRWPIMDYQRYSQLEGLEKMADETQYMKRAFRCLKAVTELGISCDAGLGYLRGPDINHLCRRFKPPVFRPVVYDYGEEDDAARTEEDEGRSLSLVILRQMAMNAGFGQDDWYKAVLRLLEDEGRTTQWVVRQVPGGKPVPERVSKIVVDRNASKDDIIEIIESLIGDDDPENATSTKPFGLTPTNLTLAQAEMLLELEWAHRALMQSYVIALMDNHDAFENLRTLTIARISGRHVDFLLNKNFWKAMDRIENFSLGVIPDWRVINKNDTGGIDQKRVSPVETCPVVYTLLNDYVGQALNIKSIHFEWICGGEFAIGVSQRDRYILPAPVLSDPSGMGDRRLDYDEKKMLSLPYVQTLSLKNCWLSPHVFLDVIRSLSKQSLTALDLESVSLSGPPASQMLYNILEQNIRPSHWPWPLCAGAEPGSWFQLQQGPGNVGNNPAAPVNPLAPNPFNNAAPPALGGAFGGPLGGLPGGPPVAPGLGNAMAPNFVMQLGGGNAFVAQHTVPPAGGAPNAHHAPAHVAAGQLFGVAHVLLQHGQGAMNLTTIPVQPQPLEPTTKVFRWRMFSWPHVLARLEMSTADLKTYYSGCDEETLEYYHELVKTEKRFSPKFRPFLQTNTGENKLQTIRFKSCGYVLVGLPFIDNSQIIPKEFIRVAHRPELLKELKDLDNSMLICNDGLLGKIINYMPDEEQHHLRNIHSLDFGWDDLYDPIVTDMAMADGNPDPGSARFHGEVKKTVPDDYTAPGDTSSGPSQ